MKSILVIDDEKEICESIKMILEYEDYHVEYATNGKDALEKVNFTSFDAILLDIQMPDMNGFELLNKFKELNIDTSVVIISAYSSVENAVKATKLGAYDFIEKPIDRDKLLISVRNAVHQTDLKRENIELKKNLSSENIIIGESPAIKNILSTVKKVAKTDARVLITGDNGTGKELVAREIHKQSSRSDNPLVEVNCAAIPNELIESELFGHEKGSFTGAVKDRVGKFEQANGGTLFLDEIGDMSLNAQAKVLRTIEDSKLERVGGAKSINIDVRIIAATNKDLKEEIKKGNFREDLYHRVNVIPINVPPLRERKEDIPVLAKHFLKTICEKNGFAPKKFSNSALDTLKEMNWSGNVRELRNLVERLVIMISKEDITEKDILSVIPTSSTDLGDMIDFSSNFQEFKEKAEKSYIIRQLENNNWNISKTAEALDIQRSHLYSKMKKYNIEKGAENG
jgi:DNA-binding NtrC family response regulator